MRTYGHTKTLTELEIQRAPTAKGEDRHSRTMWLQADPHKQLQDIHTDHLSHTWVPAKVAEAQNLSIRKAMAR